MKSYLLFPNKFRMIGWMLFIPGFILGVARQIWYYQIPGFTLKLHETSRLLKPEYENFTNELALALVVAGLLMTAFAKEKVEDELISKISANSLYWAILVSSLVRLVYITLHSFSLDMFPDVGYTMFFIPLFIFKLRFRYLITRKKDIYALDNLYYLPNRPYRIISAALSILLIGSGIYCVYNFLTAPDFLNTLANFMFLPLIVCVYTKEEKEDEFIASLRVQSMQLAVIIYYLMLLIANIILYSVPFLYIISFSTEIIAIAFLIKFNWQLRKYKVIQGGLAL